MDKDKEASPKEQKAIEKFFKLHEAKRKAQEKAREEKKLREIYYRDLPAVRLLVNMVHFDILNELKETFIEHREKSIKVLTSRLEEKEREYFKGRVYAYERAIEEIDILLSKQTST